MHDVTFCVCQLARSPVPGRGAASKVGDIAFVLDIVYNTVLLQPSVHKFSRRNVFFWFNANKKGFFFFGCGALA